MCAGVWFSACLLSTSLHFYEIFDTWGAAFVRRRGAKKKANFSSLHFYVEFDTSGANFLRMREVYCKSEFDLLHFYDVFFTWGAAFVRRCVTSDTWVAGSLHFLQWF